MECCWRCLECREERTGILSLNAQPEPGVVAKIGMGLVAIKADETNAYVVGMRHSERTTIATEALASGWEASGSSMLVPERNRSFAVASKISIPLLQPHVLMAWGSPFTLRVFERTVVLASASFVLRLIWISVRFQ
jgi:hypothetical protein